MTLVRFCDACEIHIAVEGKRRCAACLDAKPMRRMCVRCLEDYAPTGALVCEMCTFDAKRKGISLPGAA